MPDFKQITSILGSSGILAAWVAVLMGQTTWQAAVPVTAGCLVLIIMQEAGVGTAAQQAAAAAEATSGRCDGRRK